MIYLFLGPPSPEKEEKIARYKSKHLPSQESALFDYENLHAPKLHQDDLKKALDSLPSVGEKRVVVLRKIQKLSPPAKDVLLAFLKQPNDKIVLLLENEEGDSKSSFFKKISSSAKVIQCGAFEKGDVFEITKAIAQRKPAQGLKVLKDIFGEGQHPLQVLGVLVWFWGKKMKGRVPAGNFQDGLDALQKADLNIKRSRISPEQAVEVLVIRLCSLVV